MAPHDPLFKQLLKARLGDFLTLVAPDLTHFLALSEVTFVSEETFAQGAVGSSLLPDLVAHVPLLEEHRQVGEDALLVHVEIERDHRSDREMGRRMWNYARSLELRESSSVFGSVLYLRGGPPEPVEKHVRRRVPLRTMGGYGYVAWGLSAAPAEAFLARPEPLAWALAALMRPPDHWTRVDHRLACTLPIVEADLDTATRDLLLNCVATYLTMTNEERKEYEMARAQHHPKLEEIEMTYADRIAAEARSEGLAKGRTEGRAEGQRRLLVRQLEARFGPLGASTRQKVEQLDSQERLDQVATKLLLARSLDELGLG